LEKTANALGAHRILFVTVIIICKMKLFCRRIQSYRYSQHGHNSLSYLLETHWSYFTQIKSLDPESRRLGSITSTFLGRSHFSPQKSLQKNLWRWAHKISAASSGKLQQYRSTRVSRVNCGAKS